LAVFFRVGVQCHVIKIYKSTENKTHKLEEEKNSHGHTHSTNTEHI